MDRFKLAPAAKRALFDGTHTSGDRLPFTALRIEQENGALKITLLKDGTPQATFEIDLPLGRLTIDIGDIEGSIAIHFD